MLHKHEKLKNAVSLVKNRLVKKGQKLIFDLFSDIKNMISIVEGLTKWEVPDMGVPFWGVPELFKY